MKKVSISKIGLASNGNNYILVNYYEGDFSISGICFLKPDADMTKYKEGAEIEVPKEAIKAL